MRRTDPLIVGGGPAGSAAAIRLAQCGARPLLLERQREPRDVVCGGFLGRDALAALTRLGIDPAALGARPIHRVRLIAGEAQAEADLPFAAAGLSRRTLDAALLARAEAAGAGIERVGVRAWEEQALRLDDGARLTPAALFLATGKHELRGIARPKAKAPAMGLRARLAPSPALTRALAGVIELHLFPGGYAGLLLQEDGSANLCLSAREGRGGREALLSEILGRSPRLAERIDGERPAWSAIAGVPYGWRAAATTPGLFRLGDQAAVIASLAGDGVAIALTSGVRAAEAFLAGGAAAALTYQQSFSHAARRPLALAEMLRFAAERPAAGALMPLLARLPALLGALASATRIA